jgi:hypothetical protein
LVRVCARVSGCICVARAAVVARDRAGRPEHVEHLLAAGGEDDDGDEPAH